jgi:acetyltransferase-like isoleucine patch superfamily enzyme
MHTIFFILIFLSPPALKPWLLRTLCGAQVGRGVSIGWFTALGARHIALGDHCAIRALTVIRCGGDLSVGAYTVISSFNLVYGAGDLRVGEHSYIGPQCLLNCDEEIRIGRYSAIGARCMVYTHGSFLPYTEGYWVRFAPVTIGSKVWLAAGVYVSPGVRVGSNVFVHPRSLLASDVGDGSIMQGNPAVEVDRMEKLQREMTPRRLERAIGQVLDHFSEVWPALGRGVRLEAKDERGYFFRYRGRRWRVEALAAGEPLELESRRRGADRLIAVAPSVKDWSGVPDWAHVFDLESMSTNASRDPLHEAIFRFMNWYYGIKFTYRDPGARR